MDNGSYYSANTPSTRTVTDKLVRADISQQVVAVVADTPSVNFGHEGGAVYHIARILDRQILAIECQHHTEELVAKAVMSHVSGRPSTSPADTLFVRWQTAIPNLQVHKLHQVHLVDQVHQAHKYIR